MTGPSLGKLELENAKVYLVNKKKIKIEAFVYIHVKGYSLARVTHLDIEHDLLDNIIPPKRGKFLTIRGIKNGIEIELDSAKVIEDNKRKITVSSIRIIHPYLSNLLPKGGKTRTWVGGKFGGIYIGFRKKQINILEAIAKEKFNFSPI